MTAVLLTLTALTLVWLVLARPALAQPDAGSASSPFVLAPGAGLYDQFGYAPAYTRNVPAFDANGRAYLRSRTSSGAETSYIHTLEDGRWVRLDFLAALRALYPTFVQTVGAGGLRNDGIVFDRQDRAYNPVTVELSDGTTRNCLLVSWDHCRTWRAFKLPNGTFTTERWVGHNELDGPPFLAVWRESAPPDLPGSQTNALFVTQPRLEGTELVLPPLVKVTDRCLGLSRDSGGASFAATRGETTWFVWSEVAPRGKGGTPHYVSTYDRATNAIGKRYKLATSPTRSDPHNKPGICLDSAGVLHVIAGGHGAPALYTKSLAPLTADAGWTQPVPVVSTGWASETDPSVQEGRQTYPAFVCDGKDTLHLITRQWRRGVDPYHEGRGYGALVHQSCPAGGSWSEPAVIVAGAFPGYSVFFHKVALDARDRLFLSCSYQGGPELKADRAVGAALAVLGRTQLRPGKYRGRMLLVSDDGGATWRFAADADLAAPGDATSPARHAAAARTAASSALQLPALSWRWLNPLPQGNQFTGLAFSGTRTGWAVGTHGTVAGTTDGGATWGSLQSSTTADLFAVAAVTVDRAWAVGAGGTTLRTADGGATWIPAPSVTTKDIFGTCAVSRREGWAVGDRGTVLHTTNAGLTWSEKRSPTSETLFSVAFSDRLHGVIGGNRGMLLRTRDGGRTWKRRKTLTGGPLFSVAMRRDGTAAAAGAQGVVLSSADAGWTWRKTAHAHHGEPARRPPPAAGSHLGGRPRHRAAQQRRRPPLEDGAAARPWAVWRAGRPRRWTRPGRRRRRRTLPQLRRRRHLERFWQRAADRPARGGRRRRSGGARRRPRARADRGHRRVGLVVRRRGRRRDPGRPGRAGVHTLGSRHARHHRPRGWRRLLDGTPRRHRRGPAGGRRARRAHGGGGRRRRDPAHERRRRAVVVGCRGNGGRPALPGVRRRADRLGGRRGGVRRGPRRGREDHGRRRHLDRRRPARVGTRARPQLRGRRHGLGRRGGLGHRRRPAAGQHPHDGRRREHVGSADLRARRAARRARGCRRPRLGLGRAGNSAAHR